MVVIREDFALALGRALTETLENMAFMEALACPQDDGTGHEEQRLCVSLPILDPVQGELRLCAPRQLLQKVAAIIFLCDEEEIDEQILLDTAAELINTLAGRFLSRLLSPRQLFQLGLPTQPKAVGPEHGCSGTTWRYSAENLQFSLGASGDSLLRLVAQQPVPEN